MMREKGPQCEGQINCVRCQPLIRNSKSCCQKCSQIDRKCVPIFQIRDLRLLSQVKRTRTEKKKCGRKRTCIRYCWDIPLTTLDSIFKGFT